jgi:hypothetical protein
MLVHTSLRCNKNYYHYHYLLNSQCAGAVHGTLCSFTFLRHLSYSKYLQWKSFTLKFLKKI